MTRSFRDSAPFPLASASALGDSQLRANLRRATATIRAKRDRVTGELEDFEELRSAAAAIKDDALGRLDELLVEFERAFTAAGGHVHYAVDAAEANEVVTRLVARTGAREVVKVKSMTTAETGLDDALAAEGVDVAETDLAELIVQLGEDLPSHLVVPAIHRNREEVRRLFVDRMGARGLPAPADLDDAPAALAAAARSHLRERFLRSRVALSGANFAVAATGSLVVVESEGNGRMCLSLPETLVTLVGIDKLVPRFDDLEVFLQLLARSATGERMNPYTSIWSGATPGDGPRDVHVVLLDNGRSSALADRVGRQALRCIRCAACLNVCPVYERTGGHAYGSVYPGPIGAVLTPQLHRVATDEVASALPFASTLCGACYEVCPVRIDIPRLLVHLRARVVEEGRGHALERAAMGAAAAVLTSPRRLDALERLAAKAAPVLARRGLLERLPGPLAAWASARSVPVPAEPSFRAWWRAERGGPPAAGPGAERPLRAGSRARRAGRRAAPAPGRGAQVAASPGGRDAVLGAVRRALEEAPPDRRPVERAYRRAGAPGGVTDPVGEFTARVGEYGAQVVRCSPEGVGQAVAEALEAGRAGTLVVPADLPDAWLPPEGAFHLHRDRGDLTAVELDAIDAVVCGCALAIADTGTIVLDGGAAQGRRAVSLVPDHLVIVLPERAVVTSVPDAFAKLEPGRPQTWISGPSATSDIELDRVEGVHGPRRLDVVLVADRR